MSRKECKLEKIYTSLPMMYIHGMGMEGHGYYKITGKVTLEKALELVARSRNYYTSIFIHDKEGNIIYKIDLVPASNSFHCDLSFWKKKKRVKKITFDYLTYAEHVYIYL